jgi:pimeloyl-ACP methyl ester carboxylesterase
MLHGSRASLHQWDGWVGVLGNRFRIIRVDALGHGLTGPDGRGEYGAARSAFLLDQLLGRLQVDRLMLVGTSGGATEAVRFAARHPQRVDKLILSTVPLRLPAQARTAALDRAIFWTHDQLLGSNATELYWRTFLRSIVGDPERITPELVRRYRVLNSLPDQERRFRARLATWRRDGGPERDFEAAGQVVAPTLIQWGAAGPVLPAEMFCTIAGAFKKAPVRVIQYADLGHLLVMEDPARTARDALAFIETGEGGNACQTAAVASSRSAASRLRSSG